MFDTLKKEKVNVYTNTSLVEVKPDSFSFKTKDGETFDLKFDYGFVCLGLKSNTILFDSLVENFKDIPVFNIGDSLRPRKILDGIEEGRNIVSILKTK